MKVCHFTCGCPNSSNKNGGNSHDDATESSQERENLSIGS